MIYRLLRQFLRLLSQVFFRQIVVVGKHHLPLDGEPTIFAGNHPNSLIDPVLLIAVCQRKIHFAARDKLFEAPLLGALMRALGAVPIARRVDQKDAGAPVDNADAFARMHEVIASGGAVGIFPEGLSHDQAQLQQLKTGTARIALGAAASRPVQIVPCGLTYMRRKSFRSRVLIQFGEPIRVDATEVEKTHAAVREITKRLEHALRSLTINAPDWETLRRLDCARRLYQPPRIALEERVELARRFTEVHSRIADEPEVRDAMERIAHYLERLEAAGLSDGDLLRRIGRAAAFGKILRHVALFVLWLPLALPGVVLNLPVVLAARYAGNRFAPRGDVIATTKLIVGLLGFALIYGLLAIGLALRVSALTACFAMLLLPISGYALLVLADRSSALTSLLGTLMRLARLDREIEFLRSERAALEQEIVRLVDKYRPKDMVPLFSRDES